MGFPVSVPTSGGLGQEGLLEQCQEGRLETPGSVEGGCITLAVLAGAQAQQEGPGLELACRPESQHGAPGGRWVRVSLAAPALPQAQL